MTDNLLIIELLVLALFHCRPNPALLLYNAVCEASVSGVSKAGAGDTDDATP